MVLYELLASNDARCSAYCWRARMALSHKGLLPDNHIGVPFTGMAAVAFAGVSEVPVLVDREAMVAGSAAIAAYLERAYPDRASLFDGDTGAALSCFVERWIEAELHPRMLRMVIYDLSRAVHSVDREHFLASRTERMGAPLDVVQRRARLEELAAFRAALQPVRDVVAARAFISGDGPTYADYLVFASFQWFRLVSTFALLEADDPVAAWLERMLDLNDGYARAMAPAYLAAIQ